MPWYVLYTKPRQEKKVTEALLKTGINAYCPLVTMVKQWSDRKKKVQEPLLKSYVFVNVEEGKREEVFQVNGIVRYLFWLGKPAVVRDEEIQALEKALEGVTTSFEVLPLKKEEKIKISEGPFKGFEGIVKHINKSNIQLMLVDLGFLVSIKKQEI